MKHLSKFNFFFLLVLVSTTFTFCSKEDDDPKPQSSDNRLGYNPNDDLSKVPVSTNFSFSNGNLPPSHDITTKFPPIGNQGNYGTCVAWAIGYNMKSCISGIKNNLSQNQLKDPRNQFSPKYLFTALPDASKGKDCGGTNFTDPLNLVQSQGISTMQTVPYENLGNCSQSGLNNSWVTEAANNKIKSWRSIEGSVKSIKENIANNIPVVFGAKLADNFMSWQGNGVLSSITSYDNVGQHAYHAMVVAGYDDSKGANGAFRVINSWGENWADYGYIWVDYNFFLNNFVSKNGNDYSLFIAEDGDGGRVNPDPQPTQEGVDLAPWVYSDYSTYPNSQYYNERIIELNVYNIGNKTAKASSAWSYYYIYYNAYDANDYGVIFYDEFNNSIPQNTYYCPFDYNCVLNYDIPSGNSFTNVIWGQESQTRTYYMPQITGAYYLVLIADAENQFSENDEMNNLFYTTVEPKYFDGGYSYLKGSGNSKNTFNFKNDLNRTTSNLKKCEYQSTVTKKNLNAYRPDEIKKFIQNEKKSGRLQTKIKEYTKLKAQTK